MLSVKKVSLSIPSFILATACGADLPTQFDTATSGIIEGQASPANAHPSVGVMLVKENFEGQIDGGMNCSGTLIAPDVVLTAAHCLVPEKRIEAEYPGLDMKQYFSFTRDVSAFGLGTTEIPEHSYAIRGQVGHPSYVGDEAGPDATPPDNGSMEAPNSEEPAEGLGSDHDIALLFLEKPVTGFQATAIATTKQAERIVSGTEVTIVGYGQRSRAVNSQDAGIKYQAQTYIHDINKNELQVGGTRTNTALGPSKCYGDSGGPSFMRIDEKDYVIGVTSRSYNDEADCNVAGIDTRVDAYATWIQEEMKKACASGLRKCEETNPSAESSSPSSEAKPASGNSIDATQAGSRAKTMSVKRTRNLPSSCSSNGKNQTWATIIFVMLGMIWMRRGHN